MKTITKRDAIKTITTHYIDGAFVESHGREVMDIIQTDRRSSHRASHAGRRGGYAARNRRSQARIRDLRHVDTWRSAPKFLRRLHEVASARIDDLTAAMVEEYGGVVRFARPIVESGVNAFAAAEKALQEIQWTRELGQNDCDPGAGWRSRLDHGLECECAVHVPQIRFRRRRGLHRGDQAKRDEFAAGTGFGRGSARG